MKTTLALLLLSALVTARAQEAPQPPPPPVAPPAVRIPMPHEIIHDTVRRAFALAQKAVSGAAGVAASALPRGAALDLDPMTVEQQTAIRTYATPAGSSRGSRALVIRSSDSDAATTASTEEDLAIMARILDKAARSTPDDGRRFASGIEVDAAFIGSPGGARNIFIEGYGALFLLGVRYPLIAPPDKPDEAKVKDTSSDDWKRAREELQGSFRDGRAELWPEPFGPATRGAIEEFDADKVERLKAAILDSLRNATHIRALKPGDAITVVVQGAESARTEEVKELSKPARTTKEKEGARAGAVHSVNAKGYIRRTSGQAQTVMTIRVEKSDADDFAQDRITPDEFRKKAAIQTYFRKTDAGSAANHFFEAVR